MSLTSATTKSKTLKILSWSSRHVFTLQLFNSEKFHGDVRRAPDEHDDLKGFFVAKAFLSFPTRKTGLQGCDSLGFGFRKHGLRDGININRRWSC